MNLFIFSPDLAESARYFFDHDPRRANKQILEATQMIAIAAEHFGLPIPLTKVGKPYKTTAHRNHPMSKWVRRDKANFKWTLYYIFSLGWRYLEITGKRHSCYIAIDTDEQFKVRTRPDILSKDLNTVEPIFIGSSDLLESPNRIEPAMTVYEKYRLYLANKQGVKLS